MRGIFKAFLVLSLLLILGMCNLVITNPGVSSHPIFSNIWIVDQNGNGDFTNIGDAVENCTWGDTIRIWDGTYDESVYVDKRISMIGNGTDRTFWTYSISGGPCLRSWTNQFNVSRITFMDNEYGAGIDLGTSYPVVENCNFTRLRQGIFLRSYYYLIEGCNFYENGVDIGFSGGHSKSWVLNCTFNWTGRDIDCFGSLHESDNVIFKGNKFINTSFPKWLPDIIEIDTTNLVNGLPVRYFKGRSSFTVNSNSGQIFLVDCNDVIIQNIQTSNVRNAISIYGSYNIQVQNNTLLNVHDEAIYIQGENSGIEIINNTVEAQILCLHFDNGATRPLIRDNVFNNSKWGITFSTINYERCVGPKIERNSFNNCSEWAIYFYPTFGGRIWKNSFVDCEIGVWGEIRTDVEVNYYEFSENYFERGSIGVKSGRFETSLENNTFQGMEYFGVTIRYHYDPPDPTGDFLNNIFQGCSVGLKITAITGKNVIGNSFRTCNIGLKLDQTNGNMIRGNEFISNDVHVDTNSDDEWYEPLPKGGNYWSDYQHKDVKWGTQQNHDGSDGFGDVPVYIDGNNRDSYPIFRDIKKPFAEGGVDATIYQGEVYLFNSSGSFDDQMITKYTWKFEYGDETKSFNHPDFEFRFNLSGNFRITLNVSDFAGNWDSETIHLTVLDTEAPIAITGDISIEQGGIAIFNGSNSHDNDQIVNYTWSFIHGNRYYEVYGLTPSYIFEIPGYYDVTLSVKDERGNIGQTILNLTVIDTEDPVANAGPNIIYNSPDSYELDGTYSIDNGIIVSYEWTIIIDDFILKLSGPMPTFFFELFGNYSVELTVTDQFGNHDTCTISIVIKDSVLPVAVISGVTEVNPGDQVKLSGSSSTDNIGIVKYQWTIGEPISYQFEGVDLDYIFDKAGKYNVTLTVWDRANNSMSTIKVVEVVDVSSPNANAGEDRTIPAGIPITLDGSGSTDDGTIIKYKWTFTEDFVPKELVGITVTYTFTVPGTYEITLFVQDAALNYNEDTATITVIGTGLFEGSVVDENGDPIEGAKVSVICADGRTYTASSNPDGSFSFDVYFGNITWTIKASGYEVTTGSGHVDAMGSTVLESSESMLKKKDGGSSILSMIIITVILLVVLIVAVILFFVIRSRKESDSIEAGEADEEQEEGLPGMEENLLSDIPQNEELPTPEHLPEDSIPLPPQEEHNVDPINEIAQLPIRNEELTPGEMDNEIISDPSRSIDGDPTLEKSAE